MYNANTLSEIRLTSSMNFPMFSNYLSEVFPWYASFRRLCTCETFLSQLSISSLISSPF